MDQVGVLVEESTILSGCAWATGRAFDTGPEDPTWLHGLPEAEDAWRGETDRLLTAASGAEPDERGSPFTGSRVIELAEMTRAFTGFPTVLNATGMRVVSRRISEATAGQPVNDFLNSFFLDDLDLVAERASAGDLGQGLERYLTESMSIPLNERVDVQTALSAVLRRAQPAAMPPGRWPSNPDHPLALSQQLAVDLIHGGIGDGIFAINGPPGTGKTTMLRDVFASLVVGRAEKLATLSSPHAAFGAAHNWRADGYPRSVRELHRDLTGFEMVVASSNNAAVANVSDEIPGVQAIAEEYVGVIDYFADVATALLQPTSKKSSVAESTNRMSPTKGRPSREPSISLRKRRAHGP